MKQSLPLEHIGLGMGNKRESNCICSIEGCSLERVILPYCFLKREIKEGRVKAFLFYDCPVLNLYVQFDWLIGNGVKRLLSAVLQVAKKSELLCYTLQSKCWDDTEAEPRPDRDSSRFLIWSTECCIFGI